MADLRIDIGRKALKQRRTKIVATLGPASSSEEALARLIAAGVDVFRLNFSHGAQASHRETIERVRRLAAAAGRHVAILADLSGPKIRTGTFEGGGVQLIPGETILVTTRDVVGKAGLVPSQYDHLARDVRAGDRILLDDGKLSLRVLSTDGKTEVSCQVVDGGWLSNKKGMNLPGVNVSAPSLTDKDKDDATFVATLPGELRVDFIALSFVRTASDIEALRAHLWRLGQRDILVVAKIEKPEAISNIEGILDAADGIMIARGDLGVEMPAEEVPLLQNELIRMSVARNRPVIVATQMLESMIDSARPTRAEVSDVASAAFARADAVMLSAETAVGKYPVAAVETMDRVLRLVEGYQATHGDPAQRPGRGRERHADDASEALSRATSLLSADLGVRAIVVPTRSGRTARMVSAERPAAPIIALTDSPIRARALALSWGVMPEVATSEDLQNAREIAVASVQRHHLADRGQSVLLLWDASPGEQNVEPSVSILKL